ncbi:MAG: phosphonopyruvate decarboxylase [Chromatiales bacterium]|nr:MAG: phosphonopyruvate decarboxylase [Chromatiales bacterium]
MIDAGGFIAAALQRGFGLYTGVPCSYLTPFINHAINSGELRYIAAANEGDAVAIAAGAELGGRPAVVMFQNSGLGNAVNPLTSLTWAFRIPVLLIVTWRGEPGGHADEPQHELMGAITPQLLELMGIPWALFPEEESAIGPALDKAMAHMQGERRPYALVMRKGSVADTRLSAPPGRPAPQPATTIPRPVPVDQRQAVLAAIRAAALDRDLLVATTGFTGRELYALGDTANQLYMVGSMGCAVSVALGLAVARPDRRVIAIDGDGAALMRLGALTTVGAEAPPNLVHVLIDNGQHESTGGQATVSPGVDFCAIAAGAGYPAAMAAARASDVHALLADRRPSLRFLHVPVLAGVPAGLPRPAMPPAAVAERFRAWLGPRQIRA